MTDMKDNGHHAEQETTARTAAIKWGAIVIIVLAVLYFLAQYIVPLIPR